MWTEEAYCEGLDFGNEFDEEDVDYEYLERKCRKYDGIIEELETKIEEVWRKIDLELEKSNPDDDYLTYLRSERNHLSEKVSKARDKRHEYTIYRSS